MSALFSQITVMAFIQQTFDSLSYDTCVLHTRAPFLWVKVLPVEFAFRNWSFENIFYCKHFIHTKFKYHFRVITSNIFPENYRKLNMIRFFQCKKTMFSKQYSIRRNASPTKSCEQGWNAKWPLTITVYRTPLLKSVRILNKHYCEFKYMSLKTHNKNYLLNTSIYSLQ